MLTSGTGMPILIRISGGLQPATLFQADGLFSMAALPPHFEAGTSLGNFVIMELGGA